MTVETIAPYSLPPIRRLITSHNSEGQATIVRDEKVEPYISPVNGCRVTPLWTTNESPAINSEKTLDGASLLPDRMSLAVTNGTHIGSFDVAPGLGILDLHLMIHCSSFAAFYAIPHLTQPGDLVVQRGTLHTWENRGDTWARFIAVLVDAKAAEVVNKEGKAVVLKEGWA